MGTTERSCRDPLSRAIACFVISITRVTAQIMAIADGESRHVGLRRRKFQISIYRINRIGAGEATILQSSSDGTHKELSMKSERECWILVGRYNPVPKVFARVQSRGRSQ